MTRRDLLKNATLAAFTLTVSAELADRGLGEIAPAMGNVALGVTPLAVDKVKPAISPKACSFDLANVRLLDGPFKDAQQRDGAYLLSLDPDRLLHNFRVNAGLTPKAELYGGWESEGIAGHTLGHYLSALSLMYRATGDSAYKDRGEYIVGDLDLCQKQSSSGLVTAIPDANTIFAKIAADGTVTGWVPWYTTHKVLAGLRDSYLYCGSDLAKAVFLKLSDWAIAETQNLTDQQFQAMLGTEHGGMAETCADAYSITGDKKYLNLALRFTHHAVFDPLAAKEDKLDGLHSNTQIPKLIGYERIYELTGNGKYHDAPSFFWQTVVNNRSYANGGNGEYEHFFAPAQFAQHVHSDEATETCCSYNMLKLTKQLFEQDPSSAFADYYERTVYNHILASQEPDHGMMAYFMPMKPGHFKVYSDPVNSFWCCVGTGIENHARYGEAIYFRSEDSKALYVNLFVPSTLNWDQKGITLNQETDFPESEKSTLRFTCAKPVSLTLKIRKPYWTSNPSVTVNGKAVNTELGAGGYLAVERTWKGGDVVEVHLPMSLRTENLPNSASIQAVMYGPLLMVGALGTDGMDKTPDIKHDQDPYGRLPAMDTSALVTSSASITDNIAPDSGQALTFQTSGIGQPGDVKLIPMYQAHHQRLNTYWSVYTPDEWTAHKAQLVAAAAKERELDMLTVDQFLPGNQQSEVDHGLQSRNSGTGYSGNRGWRDAWGGGFFSFTMKIDPAHPMQLQCTYWGSDSGGRTFDIFVDGTKVASQTLDNNQPGEFFDVAYDIPADLIAGKQTVTVTLQPHAGNRAGGLFGCRMLRKED